MSRPFSVKNHEYDIKAVVAATDIVALISADIELKKAGNDYIARCPFHDEKTPSFTVSPGKQFYHCFGCGAHGDALDWMREYHNLPICAALEALAGPAGIDLCVMDNGATKARRRKQQVAEIEEAAVIELGVLYQGMSGRVSHRKIPRDLIERFPHIQPPPDEPFEREFVAAKRLAKALYALYGVRA